MLESSIQRNPTTSSVIPYPTLRRCISLDLEVSHKDSILLAAAAYRPDTNDSLSMASTPWPSLATRTTTWSSITRKALQEAPAELLTAWHWLTATETGSGFDLVFSTIRDAHKPSLEEASEAIRRRLDCQVQAL